MHYSQDRYEGAVSLLEKVANGVESAVHQRVVARALRYLGHIRNIQCRYNETEESYARAQEIYTRLGNDHGQAKTQDGLGDVCCAQRRYAEAADCYVRAQKTYCRVGNDHGRAHTLSVLGDVYRAQYKYSEAEESYIHRSTRDLQPHRRRVRSSELDTGTGTRAPRRTSICRSRRIAYAGARYLHSNG